MSNTWCPQLTEAINDFHDKPLGEFVAVSRAVVLVRITDKVDHRTPVRCSRKDAVKFDRLLLCPCYSDVNVLVGWKISIRRGPCKAVVGSCFYLPGTNGRPPSKVKEYVPLFGIEVVVYDNGAVSIRSTTRQGNEARRCAL